jgi:hypothetical protein
VAVATALTFVVSICAFRVSSFCIPASSWLWQASDWMRDYRDRKIAHKHNTWVIKPAQVALWLDRLVYNS